MEQVFSWVTGLLLQYGYFIVYLLAAADNFGLPAAGDVVLLAGAGLSATTGKLTWSIVVFVAFLGGLTSDTASYCIGRFGGGPLARRLLPDKVVLRVEARFQEHARTTIIGARMLAGLRAGVPVLAGTSRMPYGRFLFYNAIGVAIWALVVGTLGLVFARSLVRVAELVKQGSQVGAIAVLALVLLVAAVAWVRHRRLQARRRH